jgi:hypothetical protein
MGPDGALVAQKLENGDVTVDKVEAPKVQAVDTTVRSINIPFNLLNLGCWRLFLWLVCLLSN